jgi:large conductance mechanosensitive channel
MVNEFKQFIMRGNVLDLAVGIIIGAAFTAIVSSLVTDLLTPFIGLVTGGIDFANIFAVLKDGTVAGPYATLADAQAAGAVTVNIGVFLNAVIQFLIVALVVFLIIRAFNRMTAPIRKPEVPGEPVNKECPYCMTAIPYKASRCPNCTSDVSQTPGAKPVGAGD